jgi:hypothetical protein
MRVLFIDSERYAALGGSQKSRSRRFPGGTDNSFSSNPATSVNLIRHQPSAIIRRASDQGIICTRRGIYLAGSKLRSLIPMRLDSPGGSGGASRLSSR